MLSRPRSPPAIAAGSWVWAERLPAGSRTLGATPQPRRPRLRHRLVVMGDARHRDGADAFARMKRRHAAAHGQAVRKHQPARLLLHALLEVGARARAERRGGGLQGGALAAVRGLAVGPFEIHQRAAEI